QQLAVVGEHCGNGFSSIQRTPTPESDDHVAPLIARLLDSLLDGFDFWLTEHRKRQASNALVAKRRQQRFGTMRVPASDNQRAMAEFFRMRANFGRSTDAKDDSSGCGKFKSHDQSRIDH